MSKLKRAAAVFVCVCIALACLAVIPAFAESITVIIEDDVRIRLSPSTSAEVVTYTTEVTTATSDGTVTGADGYKWYHVILSSGKSGYVRGDLVTEKTAPQAQTVTVIIDEFVNIRQSASTSAAILTKTSTVTTATSDGTVTGTDGKKWYHVILDSGIQGYAHGDYVTESTGGNTGGNSGGNTGGNTASEYFETYFTGSKNLVMITGDGVNVRNGPGTAYATIGVTWSCVMENLGKSGSWYQVKTPGGKVGYIYDDYVAEYTYTPDAAFESTLAQFPESYRAGLRYLHTLHPNWRFYADTLSISLKDAVDNEAGRKLLSNYYTVTYNYLPENWRASSGITTLEAGYGYASKYAISYAMAPENFITEKSVFMFMLHSYDPSTQNANTVKKIVANTFLDRSDYIGYLIEAAEQSGVNPDILAGIILQEQGSGGSSLSSGDYPGYEGYYNFYNFSASGSTTAQIIENGLKYAKEKGWNSARVAIIEGAKQYGKNYVNDKQYTHYYKDYNVINQTWWFQYASNLFDHISNAAKVYAGYSEKNSTVTFRIPVFAETTTSAHTHSWSGTLQYDAANHFYRCVTCGETKDTAAHTYGAWVISKAATCTAAGEQYRTCTVCGYRQTAAVAMTAHTYQSIWTADATGHRHECTVCGQIKDFSAHTYDDWRTVSVNGEYIKQSRICSVCAYEETRNVPTAGKKLDFNGDGTIDDRDAVYLLFHIYFPKLYPVSCDCDFNSDKVINDKDAAYFLFFTFFPEEYPINN